VNYRLVHRTCYEYGQPVSLGHSEARLTPRALPHQECLQHQLAIEPPPSALRRRVDFFGNEVTYSAIQQPHRKMVVMATSQVRVEPGDRRPLPELPWEEARECLRREDGEEILQARPFALDSPLIAAGEELARYAAPSFGKERPLVEAASELMSRIHRDFSFVPGFTTVSTPLSQVFEHRRGVCQDFAHLGIGCLRSLGLAARYVSGYIETLPPPGKERLKGADASHAWLALFVPGWGWLDFDPTNDLRPAERHLTLAWGRDYGDVPPLKGVVFGSGEHRLEVAVDMERI
jgi:transglutaminase-like putative cysteine protease